jgi:hypothetical protein
MVSRSPAILPEELDICFVRCRRFLGLSLMVRFEAGRWREGRFEVFARTAQVPNMLSHHAGVSALERLRQHLLSEGWVRARGPLILDRREAGLLAKYTRRGALE